MQPAAPLPILLYNGECAVCIRVAAWVRASEPGTPVIDVRPIGDDPEAIAQLHPGLDIWDAYETVHLLMPDGSMKTGGAAVAEVLRRLPNTRWSSGLLNAHVGGIRPAAALVDLGYNVLADVRPLLGCASCGSTNAAVRSVHETLDWLGRTLRAERRALVPPFRSASRHVPRLKQKTPV